MLTVAKLKKQGKYIYRYSQICFNGNGIKAPQRKDDLIDEWDKIFDSKEDFEKWYKDLVINLAELDQVMNYCKYFVRLKGNNGNYVREGKTCPVNGLWDCYHINTPEMSQFNDFIIKNGWKNNWFDLMDRYKQTI
jgi:hypothetical protein